MTFSHACHDVAGTGTAWVVPLRQEVVTPPQLHDEADALAVAEGLFDEKDITSGRPAEMLKWKGFGAVGLWVRESYKPTRGLAEFTENWPGFFRKRLPKDNGALKGYPATEPLPLTAEGRINLRWPVRVESTRPLEFDLLLATPNTPSLGPDEDYATPDEIAKSYIRSGDPGYFIDNLVTGIHTAEDAEIWKQMQAKSDVVFRLREAEHRVPR